MPKPGEHKTVEARILEYAQHIGCTFVPRAEAESRRALYPSAPNPSLREFRGRDTYLLTSSGERKRERRKHGLASNRGT